MAVTTQKYTNKKNDYFLIIGSTLVTDEYYKIIVKDRKATVQLKHINSKGHYVAQEYEAATIKQAKADCIAELSLKESAAFEESRKHLKGIV